jgi:hypothetical protein
VAEEERKRMEEEEIKRIEDKQEEQRKIQIQLEEKSRRFLEKARLDHENAMRKEMSRKQSHRNADANKEKKRKANYEIWSSQPRPSNSTPEMDLKPAEPKFSRPAEPKWIFFCKCGTSRMFACEHCGRNADWKERQAMLKMGLI